MKPQQFFYLIFFFLFSCAEKETKTIWIYPYLLNGELSPYAEPGIFLLTQESENLDYSRWNRRSENFEIKGFKFEEEYFYKLKVKVEENTPPEKYKLNSVLEKKKDFIRRIEGNWRNVPIHGQAYFPISIRINKVNRSLLTFGGCASGLTGLGEVSERKIQLADKYYRLDVDKICLAQNPPPRADFGFTGNTVEYQITPKGFLEFFDASGNLLIRFEPSA
ncbi:MAG: DUF4377 domain-containing protein [Algoriphagus sp.]|uniref:DUF4377 domain-containing protein n=1 Tax=Algoriphagus sp. TaxID=1872435 RepID=UPI0027317951|nr:DUF4377 domain-containing protein [Algoriphagus sp.]MDP2041560.1 DUF4377 domain-containing protein [Algoriphagus sp.]MDP3474145.1 DUF4377 domain-containing protein [Algoriphagus sp.]